MAQIQVNLEGVPITVDNRRVSLGILQLDARNPRMGLFSDSQPKTTFSDEEIRHAIVNRNPDAYTKLRDAIEINQGVIHPIWIAPPQHGKHLVIEGNTRVLIYAELAEKYPTNDVWKTIPANVLPMGISDSQMNFVRLEAHLRGITPWDAYERARYLYILNEEEGYSVKRLEQLTRLRHAEIETEIRAFRDMSEVYSARFHDDPYQSQKFSYFVEYERNNRLKQQVQEAGLGIVDFCDWVGTQRIPKAEDVRTLGDILADSKASQYFLQDGYGRAIQHLSLTQPDLVSPLFQRIEDVIERLKRLTFYEVEEICVGKQPGRKRLIEELASVAGQIWRRVSEGEEGTSDEQAEDEL
jgi:hypothetical protein